MAAEPQVFLLKCSTQKYAWGKIGNDSAVAQLKKNVDDGFVVEDETPYAELWMGTHPNGPSMVSINGKEEESLADWIKRNPDSLGSKVKERFRGELPFLFKVLSVRTALSIQAHPHKALAEKLHADKPDKYKDPNHKPEMAIALTPFQGLCGFRPISEVAHYLQEILEFRTAVGNHNAVQLLTSSKCTDGPHQRGKMKLCFAGLMNQSDEIVKEQLEKLVARVQEMKQEGKDTTCLQGDLLMKLHQEFPGDRGGFAIYFLNVITLQPGEAMFLDANLPHAYLSGDCMECMACSDNVVRAGLTIKFRDVHTLVEMLDYTGKNAASTKFKGLTQQDGDVVKTIFRPPVIDFSVARYQVPAGVASLDVPALSSASICMVVEGAGEITSATLSASIPLKRGTVFFISAKEQACISINQSGPLLLFRAYAGL